MTSCCARPCYTFGGTQFELLLCPFALQLRIASCSCNVSLKMLAFSQACLQSSIASCFCCVLRQRLHPLVLSLQSPRALAACLRQCSHSHEQRFIIVGPSSLGCHCCWAAIIVKLPLSPYPLRPPPNALFFVVVGMPSLPYSRGSPLPVFSHVLPRRLIVASSCRTSAPACSRRTTCLLPNPLTLSRLTSRPSSSTQSST